MNTLNRKSPPPILPLEKIHLLQAETVNLDNGIPVGLVNAGTQALIKIELIFPAGIWHQLMPLQSSFSNAMTEEGTTTRSAAEIADAVDYYGGFLEQEVGQDWASIILYTLNKHVGKVLPILEDVVKNPSFPVEELNVMLQNRKQGFMVDNQKVAYLARTKFNSLLFGDTHPYANKIELKDFDQLKRENLNTFYADHYNADNCKMIVSGKIQPGLIHEINKYFGGNDWKGKTIVASAHPAIPTVANGGRIHTVEKSDAVQSAIRMGKLLFNKLHPDYHSVKVMSTILGGYFGSRLMSNIREDKGYTYGIGSRVITMQNAGYFFISTEVGAEVCKAAIDEIYLELDKICNTPVPSDELELVKSYMLGEFVRSLDGPFALADKYKKIMLYGLTYDYYDQFVNKIKACTPEGLMEIANKHLRGDDMIELVAGKRQ